MNITIEHDNGNQVCFTDGSVYVRQNREYFAPDGTFLPGMGEVIAAVADVAFGYGIDVGRVNA